MRKQKEKRKKCFLITPIGAPGSLDRIRVDQWTEMIYSPSIRKEFFIERADLISTPGVITRQIIDNIFDSELAIIDYTPNAGTVVPNPNVMYEAAIRHIAKKPFIQIAPVNLKLPFDIQHFRCVLYDPNDLSYPKKLRINLKKAIKEVLDPEYKTPDIVGHTFDIERIVSDPEKFVQILKDLIFPNKSKSSLFEYAANYGMSNEYLSASASLSPSISTTNYPGTISHNLKGDHYGARTAYALCPRCGSEVSPYNANTKTTLKSIMQTAAGTASFQYYCNTCGFTF